jgi:hypothetical protein
LVIIFFIFLDFILLIILFIINMDYKKKYEKYKRKYLDLQKNGGWYGSIGNDPVRRQMSYRERIAEDFRARQDRRAQRQYDREEMREQGMPSRGRFSRY